MKHHRPAEGGPEAKVNAAGWALNFGFRAITSNKAFEVYLRGGGVKRWI
jgi:hypothetical protein